MKLIPLTQGMFAQVDDVDFERCAARKWHYRKNLKGEGGYAATWGRVGTDEPRTYFLHTFIKRAKRGRMVDHRNRDGLDCKRRNLRFCTSAQNNGNRRGSRDGFKGVAPRGDSFRARLKIGGKTYWGGSHPTAEAAARAHDALAIKHRGEFAFLNFPP